MLRSLLPLAGVSAAVLVGAPAAEALTFTISGTYNLPVAPSTSGAISGYFNWDGATFTGGEVNMTAVPNSGGDNTSIWSRTNEQFYVTNTNESFIVWNALGTSNRGDSIRLNLSTPLPTGTLDPYSSAAISSVEYCYRADEGNFISTFNPSGTCNQTTTSINLTNGLAKAPSPVSALLLLPFGSLLMLRRRVLSPLLNN